MPEWHNTISYTHLCVSELLVCLQVCQVPVDLVSAQLHVFKLLPLVCGEKGVKLGVGLMMRFHACHREALRLIEAGRLGTPVLARAQLSCWYPPIAGAWRQDPARDRPVDIQRGKLIADEITRAARLLCRELFTDRLDNFLDPNGRIRGSFRRIVILAPEMSPERILVD